MIKQRYYGIFTSSILIIILVSGCIGLNSEYKKVNNQTTESIYGSVNGSFEQAYQVIQKQSVFIDSVKTLLKPSFSTELNQSCERFSSIIAARGSCNTCGVSETCELVWNKENYSFFVMDQDYRDKRGSYYDKIDRYVIIKGYFGNLTDVPEYFLKDSSSTEEKEANYADLKIEHLTSSLGNIYIFDNCMLISNSSSENEIPLAVKKCKFDMNYKINYTHYTQIEKEIKIESKTNVQKALTLCYDLFKLTYDIITLDYCYKDVAKKSGNYSICGETYEDFIKESCYYELAELKKSYSACYNLNISQKFYSRDECFVMIARVTDNETVCGLITDERLKDECSTILTERKERKNTNTCTDSDGGNNYYLKGACSGGLLSGDDHCTDDNYLYEVSCDTASDDCYGQTYRCPNGCMDGACIVK